MSLIKKEFKINTATFSCLIFTLIKPDGTEEFWFKGKDIAEFLDYKDTKQAIVKNVHEKWRCTWENLQGRLRDALVDLPKIHPQTVFISEPGLYALITRSTKPEAITFSSWVYEEVLPSLRKTGEYKMALQEKDHKIEELASGLLKANDALILATKNLCIANTNLIQARQDAVNAFNRVADIAQDVIAKPTQAELLHTLALHKLDKNEYKFTRCQKRSLSTALKKIKKENPGAIEMYCNGYVPNGVNVLNVLKERLKEGKVSYKATNNVIKILEEMSEEEVIRTVQEILKKDFK